LKQGGQSREQKGGGSHRIADWPSGGAAVSNQMSTKKQTGCLSGSAPSELQRILEANQRGVHTGIYSVCSANKAVLEAAMAQALRDDSLVCIESTSNQVNQYGGYTGQTANDFAAFVSDAAKEMQFPAGRIVLGGDHLGPHAWRMEKSIKALAKARELVKSYVRAGYTKIHLDASMRCADDGGDTQQPLEDRIVSARTAELCAAAEEAHRCVAAEMPGGGAVRPRRHQRLDDGIDVRRNRSAFILTFPERANLALKGRNHARRHGISQCGADFLQVMTPDVRDLLDRRFLDDVTEFGEMLAKGFGDLIVPG